MAKRALRWLLDRKAQPTRPAEPHQPLQLMRLERRRVLSVTAVDIGTTPSAISEGGSISLVGATFSDDDPIGGGSDNGPWTGTIDWGDGNQTALTDSGGGLTNPTGGGDGTASGSHTYTDNGVYTVTLTIEGADMTSMADSFMVTVNNVAPTVDAGSDQTVNEGDTVNISASFTDPSSDDTFTATIDWGDGSALVNVNPATSPIADNHVYADDGVYTVTVTVTDDDGGVNNDTLQVTVNNVAPTVNAGSDQTVNEGDTVNISASFTDPGSGDTFTATIDWGDGSALVNVNPATSPIADSHVYADDGVYTVTVTVTDDNGGVNNDTLQVTVNNVAPTVNAGSDQTVNEGDTVNISASFTDPGSADTFTATIDWGDGSALVNVNPATSPIAANHVYADNGVYTVTVTVTDDNGGVNSDTLQVTVNNAAPAPAIVGAPTNSDEGTLISLSVTENDPGSADTFTYLWQVSATNGQIIANGTNSTFNFTPNDNGTYTVTLTVTDDDGGMGMDTAIITVDNAAPAVNAGSDQTVNEGDTVNISAAFTDPSSVDTFTATIDWGDGSPLVNVNPATSPIAAGHVYTDNGVFTVTVTVTDDDGGTSSDTLQVTVNNVAPAVNAGSDQTVNEGDTVNISPTFTDAGSSDTFTATIDWGDGSALVNVNPATSPIAAGHVYADNGVFTVTVTVTDDDGGMSSDTLQVTVNNVAPAVNAGSDQTVNEGDTVNISAAFTDPGSGDTFTATIDWGDGSPLVNVNPATSPIAAGHVYADNGVFTVTVTVTDDDGGVNSDTLQVTVNNVAPTVNAGSDQTVSQGDTVSISAAFTDPGSADTFTATIDWGDGSSLVNVNPATSPIAANHVYTSDGVFTVTVTVTDDDGGVNSDTLLVTVFDPTPAVQAPMLSATAISEGGSVTLSGSFSAQAITDLNAVVGDYTVIVEWGDGTSQEITSFTPNGTLQEFSVAHTYSDDDADDLYTITVTAAYDPDGNFNPATPDTTFLAAANINVGVSNVDPTVTAGTLSASATTVLPGQTLTILPGTLVTANFSFSDPGFDTESFSYRIDWGPTATGVQSVATVINGNGSTPTVGSFTDSNTYTTPGTYTVTVEIADDDNSFAGGGPFTTTTFTVTVTDPTPVPGALTATPSVINEGGSTVLSGTFTAAAIDAGLATASDYSGTVDWGDGTLSAISGFTVISTGPTVLFYTANHVYADDAVYNPTVTLSLTSDPTFNSASATAVTVLNVAPTITTSTLTSPSFTSGSVPIGEQVSLTIAFSDPGFDFTTTTEDFTYSIDWGDGTTSGPTAVPTVVNGSAGTATTGSVVLTHTYATGQTNSITVTVQDDDGGSTPVVIVVDSVDTDPNTSFSFGQPVVLEGQTAVVNGNFLATSTSIFARPFSQYVVDVDWGDGNTSPVTGITLPAPTTADPNPLATFQIQHVYGDDGPNDAYDVTINVFEPITGNTDTLVIPIGVSNVAPLVSAGLTPVDPMLPGFDATRTNIFDVDAVFDDDGYDVPGGPQESHTATIDWGDGSPIETITINDTSGATFSQGDFAARHTFASAGAFTITVAVTDDDGGVGTFLLSAIIGVEDIPVESEIDTEDIGNSDAIGLSSFSFLGLGGTGTDLAINSFRVDLGAFKLPAGGSTGINQQGFVLTIVSASGDESEDIWLDPEDVKDLRRLFAPLPDNLYRIYWVQEDGVRRLVTEISVRGGRLVDASVEDLVGSSDSITADEPSPETLPVDSEATTPPPVSQPLETGQHEAPPEHNQPSGQNEAALRRIDAGLASVGRNHWSPEQIAARRAKQQS